MNRVHLNILIGMILILLIGAGCSDTKNTNTPDGPVDNETVVPSTPIQQAYALCVSQGYLFDINQTDRGYEFFCLFPEERRCDALAFLNEECRRDIAVKVITPSSTASIDDVFDAPRFCEPIAEPVCGNDGRTYSNSCIAKQQGVELAHQGTCTEGQEPSNPPTVPEPPITGNGVAQGGTSSNNSESSSVPPQSDYSAPEPIYTEQGIPDWVAVPFSLVKDNPSIASASVARCSVAGTIYYLQVENCPTCFSTLYSDNGSLMCNPSHDLNGSCPAAFANGNVPSSCQVVLRK